jgi:hypothetical protein
MSIAMAQLAQQAQQSAIEAELARAGLDLKREIAQADADQGAAAIAARTADNQARLAASMALEASDPVQQGKRVRLEAMSRVNEAVSQGQNKVDALIDNWADIAGDNPAALASGLDRLTQMQVQTKGEGYLDKGMIEDARQAEIRWLQAKAAFEAIPVDDGGVVLPSRERTAYASALAAYNYWRERQGEAPISDPALFGDVEEPNTPPPDSRSLPRKGFDALVEARKMRNPFLLAPTVLRGLGVIGGGGATPDEEFVFDPATNQLVPKR